LKSESDVLEKPVSVGAVRENAGGNDTVPISVWRGKGMRCIPTAVAIVTTYMRGSPVDLASGNINTGGVTYMSRDYSPSASKDTADH